MTRNYPNTMDARVFDWMTTVLFLVCEVDAVANIYFWSKHSAFPFFFLAYFLPFLVAIPWISGKKLRKLLQPSLERLDARGQSVLSIQISMGTVMAYVLFGMSLTLPKILRVS